MIQGALELAGVRVWIDILDLPSTATLRAATQEAMLKAPFALIILQPGCLNRCSEEDPYSVELMAMLSLREPQSIAIWVFDTNNLSEIWRGAGEDGDPEAVVIDALKDFTADHQIHFIDDFNVDKAVEGLARQIGDFERTGRLDWEAQPWLNAEGKLALGSDNNARNDNNNNNNSK